MSVQSSIHGHDHVFLGEDHDRNARRTWMVIALTATMMVVEIVAGYHFGSMALVADGWHMSTHAAAMLITALAYSYARRHAHDPRFTFGTGKVGELAAFASAIVLALIALLIGWESLTRLYAPVEISFREAIAVAVVGLAVNLVSAWLLGGGHSHGGHAHGHGKDHAHGHGKERPHEHDHAESHAHDHDHPHDHDHDNDHGAHAHTHGAHAPHSAGHTDNNFRAAYLHVLADALTSVLAIGALVAGSLYGWNWLDPAMGIVGALVIARWSWTLVRDAGRVLVDYVPEQEYLPGEIRAALETPEDEITDLHVWQVGPGHHAAIIALRSPHPRAPEAYKAKLAGISDLSHVTVEVAAA